MLKAQLTYKALASSQLRKLIIIQFLREQKQHHRREYYNTKWMKIEQ